MSLFIFFESVGVLFEGAFSLWVSLKSDFHLPRKIIFICFNESPFKMMKNAFCFILKALFVLKILKFLSRHFGHVEETAWLER